jgi:L-threonylcarbamoyladenylate synthase
VIVIPTDSRYRMICRLDRPRAIERLSAHVHRDRSSSLVILGANAQSLLELITDDLTKPILLANRFWPGLVTVVGRASDRVPASLLGPGFKHELSVPLRMPNHQTALNILSQLPGQAAASATVRLAENQSSATFEQIVELLGDTVDSVVPDADDQCQWRYATVVDVVENPPNILKVGDIDADQIFACLSENGLQ